MNNVFVLSKQDISLAKEEVLALLLYPSFILVNNLLILKTKKEILPRLAYTKQQNKLLFQTTKKSLAKDIAQFKWKNVYKPSFAVRVHGLPERKIAALIWEALQEQGLKPKVNLSKPKILIEIFTIKNKVLVTIQEKRNTEDFESRKAHNRPEYTPVSLHPKLARALVNLTGIQKGTILDPMCGTGGILIEAGLMGLTPVGSDLSQRMVNTSKINLKHYKVKAKVKKQDATTIKKKYNYVVADLPYGISTSHIQLKETYRAFLDTLSHILKKRAVLTFPNKVPKALILKSKLRIIKTFDYYLHKNLTKKIVIVEPIS